MLCVLNKVIKTAIVICLLLSSAVAGNDVVFMESSLQQRQEAIRDMMDQDGFDQEMKEEISNPKPMLQIFVNSSMPKALLKAYAKEAKQYGGVLIFNGLPEGSFLKLIKLVYEISEEDGVPMQIDDESFVAYHVGEVPSIVLSRDGSQFAEYDKVVGAITVKGALELFANNGDLALYARGLLE